MKIVKFQPELIQKKRMKRNKYKKLLDKLVKIS